MHAAAARLFRSFFLGGFECSSHIRPDGRRLDLIAATGHDRLADWDYAAMRYFGLRTVRDGLRWHRIERTAGRYTFAADLPMVRAAQRTGTQVIWDLCHYGWPDGLSPFAPEFGRRLAGLARAFVRLLANEGQASPLIVPINEISFLSWIGGTKGWFPPFRTDRGDELKRCLVRAAIECIEAVWSVTPAARICVVDPIIHIVGTGQPQVDREAEAYRRAQYTGWDMLAGRVAPELGGRPAYLDVIGVNYYVHNQWIYAGGGEALRILTRRDPGYRPVSELLAEVYARYRRPLFIAETGIEGSRRVRWLRHIARQAELAMNLGVPIAGLCLYPITDYPGWDNDRHCRAGLLGYPDAAGHRPVYRPLARELRRQQARFEPQGAAIRGAAAGVALFPSLRRSGPAARDAV